MRLSGHKTFWTVKAIAIAAIIGGCSLDTTPEGLAALAIISGSQQTVKVGAMSAQPLVVRAFDVNGLSISDIEVRWTVAANGGTVSASRTLTDDTGTTSVNYTAPSTPGNVQVRATADELTVTFNLIIEPGT